MSQFVKHCSVEWRALQAQRSGAKVGQKVAVLIYNVVCFSAARITGLQEDNKNLKLGFGKVEAERKQAQERSNTLEKVNASKH